MLLAASEAVQQIPETFGHWKMVAAEPLPDTALTMLQCRAHQSRHYAHDETGEQVSFMLLVGPAGPLVAHTPDVCYGSSAFDIAESTESEVIRGTGSSADTFNRILFRSKSVIGEKQEVYYGWRPPAGHWEAPQKPRLALGGEPLLYKIQVAAVIPDQADGADDATKSAVSPNRRFLDDLLPVLDVHLQNR